MATYRIKYADGTRDIQTVANKTLLRFDARNGHPTPVDSVKRIDLREAKSMVEAQNRLKAARSDAEFLAAQAHFEQVEAEWIELGTAIGLVAKS